MNTRILNLNAENYRLLEVHNIDNFKNLLIQNFIQIFDIVA